MKRLPGWPSHAAIMTILERYETARAADLAVELGVPVGAVYRLAGSLGLRKAPPWHSDETLAEVRRLHGQGLPDREIATRTGLSHDAVKAIRRERLKLPVNPDIEGKREAVRTQMKTLGIRHGGDLRRLAYRNFAVENGWPEDLRPREVQILNVLAAQGVPMTKLEIAAAIGANESERWDTGKRRILLSGNGPGGTYTASLIRRGLVMALKRAATVSGRGRGRSRDLYALGPAALAILQERAKACDRRASAQPSPSASNAQSGMYSGSIASTAAPSCSI